MINAPLPYCTVAAYTVDLNTDVHTPLHTLLCPAQPSPVDWMIWMIWIRSGNSEFACSAQLSSSAPVSFSVQVALLWLCFAVWTLSLHPFSAHALPE